MARPVKWRKIENIPTVPYFVPSEKDIDEIPGNVLKLEELEAVRLKDLEGLEQEECAQKMQVSRPTFQRILISAREKITDSLVNGKTLKIEGGNFTRNICPSCGSDKVKCRKSCERKFCKRQCCKFNNVI
jgi:predicted DNA-binding protein (UPF0251 family)